MGVSTEDVRVALAAWRANRAEAMAHADMVVACDASAGAIDAWLATYEPYVSALSMLGQVLEKPDHPAEFDRLAAAFRGRWSEVPDDGLPATREADVYEFAKCYRRTFAELLSEKVYSSEGESGIERLDRAVYGSAR